MRRPTLLVAMALVAVTLAGCADEDVVAEEPPRPATTYKPAYGDTYIDSLIGNIAGLIPNITTDKPSHDVGDLIYEGLVTYDKDLNIVGRLAESWEQSRDCQTLTFKLRRDVRWHDGQPFTANDVLFTHAAMVHPKTPSAYKDDFHAVERIEAVDAYTVRVTYRQPHAKALQSWSMSMLPKHLLEGHVRDGRLREAPQHREAPVGTGPYRFKEWRPGEKVVLVANADYYDGRPYIGRVVFRIIPSQATTFLELKAKGIDSAQLTALQFERQTKFPAFQKAYQKFPYPGNNLTYLALNGKDPRFADRRVRWAISHAINRRELIEAVILGHGEEATGSFKPGTWAYNPDARRFPYDLERAQTLLAAAGWKERDAEGVLVKDGKRFEFEILTNQGNDERKKNAEIIQASLRQLGIDVEVRVMEWATLLKEHVRKRRFDALALGWGLARDPDQYNLWHSSKRNPEDFNITSYANAEVDALLERGRASCNQEERVQYYRRIHEILAEDQPVLFLYFREVLPVVASRFKGIVPGPNGISHNFREWFVPRELQRYTSG